MVTTQSHTKKYTDMLERLQKRATKLVPSLKNLPYEERLRSLNLPTLQYRRMRSDLIHIYKLTHNMLEMDTDTHCMKCKHSTEMLQRSLRPSNRGHSHKFQAHHHPGIRNRFLTSRAFSHWNNLSEKTENSNTLNIFKNNLRKESSLPHKIMKTFECKWMKVIKETRNQQHLKCQPLLPVGTFSWLF